MTGHSTQPQLQAQEPLLVVALPFHHAFLFSKAMHHSWFTELSIFGPISDYSTALTIHFYLLLHLVIASAATDSFWWVLLYFY